jgi:hypothetical protein
MALLGINEDFVDLFNQLVEARERLEQTFGNQNAAVVLVVLRTVGNRITDSVHDVLECFSCMVGLL